MNKIAIAVYFICVTVVVIFFEDPNLLWLLAFGLILI